MTLREIISRSTGTSYFKLYDKVLDYSLVVMDNNEIPKNFQNIGKLAGFEPNRFVINHGTREVELFL